MCEVISYTSQHMKIVVNVFIVQTDSITNINSRV